MVQWLRLHASSAGGPSSIHGSENRLHMPQLRPSAAKLRNMKKKKKKTFSQQIALLWSVTPSPPPQERRVRLAVCSACRSSGWLGVMKMTPLQYSWAEGGSNSVLAIQSREPQASVSHFLPERFIGMQSSDHFSFSLTAAGTLYPLIILSCYRTQRRQWHPTPVLLPGKSHGQRNLEGCSRWGR